MGNKFGYTLGFGVILGVCYLTADLALTNFLSEERLRVMLIEPLQDQLGRQVEVGSIKVSVFSGIEIKDISIKEKSPGQEFAAIGSCRLNYDPLPLFEKRLVITEVLIDKPTVRIERDSQGAFNFADLSLTPRKVAKEIPPPELQKALPLPLTLGLDQIKVSNLNLTFTDQSGRLPTITSTVGDFTGALTLGKTLAETRYRGSLELVVNSEYQTHRLVLLIKSTFDNQLINFNGELNAGLDKLLFTGQLANLQSTPNLTLDLQAAKLDLNNLLAATPPLGNGVVSPTLPPVTQVSSAPISNSEQTHAKLHAHGKVQIKELRRDKLALENFSLTYTLADNVLALSDLTAGLGGGRISGKANLDLSHSAPTFRGQFKADKIQLATARASQEKEKGYLTGELSADFSGLGVGGSWPEIRDSLDGQGKFVISKGEMANFPFSQELASLLGLPELNDLKFDKISGTVKIGGAQAALNASLSARALSLQSQGNVTLGGNLDLPLTVKLSPENSRHLQERPIFARYPPDPSGRTILNLKLKGTFEHPDLRLNGG